MYKGQCLCGEVTFQIDGQVTDVYKCHCSVCRRATGAGGIAACMTSSDDFTWTSGEANLGSFRRSERYYVNFCKTCGSPAPMLHPEGNAYWIPAGLLKNKDLQIGAHVYVGSCADWDVVGDDALTFEEGFPES